MKIPGLIDIHVHLRDPGQTQKEDFLTGTSAALAGGVTTVLDMPNNLKPIFTLEALQEKMEIAKKKAVCDYGFYFGTDGENFEEFNKVKDLVIGLKIYFTLTTGKYLLDNPAKLEKVFETWPKDRVIIAHAQGDKIELALNLAKKFGNKLHITHLSTRNDLQKVLTAKVLNPNITCDVTPHHLFLTSADLLLLKGFGEVKPPLETEENQKFLWKNLKNIDCIATDHAPHTKEEKVSTNPPSGMPGLETMLPLLLNSVHEGKLTIEDIIRLTHTNPQRIFGIKQHNDTYIEVDLDEKYTIENKNLKTKCGWSPFAKNEIYGRVQKVFIRGTKVFENGQVLVKPGFGKFIYT
ncbi:hypothetical protein A2773_00245 [Candidatus Gottesmanbacteria bacterium RIFCSPHIGHO2_01_FULL_39_10]|uniref:Amidohydrolase-related domain-containing protein n=1 Tax=Candidatus Gottesmanbacteria bacterium RIFCSPHIGHO2_01_FULL_39_10 TaxID=1798375 RepID=A0A1F5ZL11_9BACT|nr:MAG: hypothetical protein A2773_00245 [Candidatus Gottesmanbacteria bacterium RIFCSPHIGHO2_01_FULL_39_10]